MSERDIKEVLRLYDTTELSKREIAMKLIMVKKIR